MCPNGCSYEYDEQEEELTHTHILKPRCRKITRVCVGLNRVCAGYKTHGFVCVLTDALTNMTRKKKNSRIHIL